jgi:hypothetical protein
MTRMRRETGEALLAPSRNRRSKEKPYNRYTAYVGLSRGKPRVPGMTESIFSAMSTPIRRLPSHSSHSPRAWCSKVTRPVSSFVLNPPNGFLDLVMSMSAVPEDPKNRIVETVCQYDTRAESWDAP